MNVRGGLIQELAQIPVGVMPEEPDVYQATDSKLGRSVAVKFLPEAFARDADRVTRFEREARVLASLNHPNIAAIYGLEDSDSQTKRSIRRRLNGGSRNACNTKRPQLEFCSRYFPSVDDANRVMPSSQHNFIFGRCWPSSG